MNWKNYCRNYYKDVVIRPSNMLLCKGFCGFIKDLTARKGTYYNTVNAGDGRNERVCINGKKEFNDVCRFEKTGG